MRGKGLAMTATLVVGALLTGCGLTPSHGVSDIDPASLPAELVATRAPTPTPSATPAKAGGAVYFVKDDRLVRRSKVLGTEAGSGAVQELLDALAAGPGDVDRDGGVSTAIPPSTVLRLAGFEGDIVTVDLTVDQLPPNQTVAIAQLVLTVTSLAEVNGLRVTINGERINAPLASGAQTDRPLTRADYDEMLDEGF